MSDTTALFDLSDLVVTTIDVTSVDTVDYEHLTDGHAMTELAGSSGCGLCQRSSASFVGEDDLV